MGMYSTSTSSFARHIRTNKIRLYKYCMRYESEISHLSSYSSIWTTLHFHCSCGLQT